VLVFKDFLLFCKLNVAKSGQNYKKNCTYANKNVFFCKKYRSSVSFCPKMGLKMVRIADY